jgi:hypothetical protein
VFGALAEAMREPAGDRLSRSRGGSVLRKPQQPPLEFKLAGGSSRSNAPPVIRWLEAASAATAVIAGIGSVFALAATTGRIDHPRFTGTLRSALAVQFSPYSFDSCVHPRDGGQCVR